MGGGGLDEGVEVGVGEVELAGDEEGSPGAEVKGGLFEGAGEGEICHFCDLGGF